MTHSLHRSGDIESQKNDYVWFMYQTKGVNDVNIKPKALEFIAVAEAVGSENWGGRQDRPQAQIFHRKNKGQPVRQIPYPWNFYEKRTGGRIFETDQGKGSGHVRCDIRRFIRSDPRL